MGRSAGGSLKSMGWLDLWHTPWKTQTCAPWLTTSYQVFGALCLPCFSWDTHEGCWCDNVSWRSLSAVRSVADPVNVSAPFNPALVYNAYIKPRTGFLSKWRVVNLRWFLQSFAVCVWKYDCQTQNRIFGILFWLVSSAMLNIRIHFTGRC